MPRPRPASRRRGSHPRHLATGLGAFAPAVVWIVLVALDAPAWAERSVAGVGIVLLAGLLLRERVVSRARHAEAIEAERRLTADRATIVQLVSHEFRTPLTMIRGGVETLFARADVDESLRPVVDAVQRATARLDGMLSMVLAAADRFEVEEHERAGTRLETVIAGVVDGLTTQDAGRVRVEVTAVAGVETHVARRGIVGLLLQTILDNALKFSPPHELVHVQGHVTDSEIVLRVEDHGPGLSPDFADRAFEMFTQQDASESRPQPGLGMGLFTARRLTTRLGGRIELTDAPGGVGCVAEVRLPRVLPTEARLDAAAGADRRYLAHR